MRSLALALIVTAHAARAQRIPTFITSPLLTVKDSIGDTTRTSSRLTDARRLSDGRIIAAVCGANELRSYDAKGQPIASLTLPNSPRPQRLLWRLMAAGGDTVAAYTGINSGVTLIDPSFKVAREIPLPNPDTTTFQGRPRASRLDVIGRFSNGTWVGRMQPNPPDGSAGYGVDRRSISLYHFDESGAILDSVTVAGAEFLRIAGQRSMQVPRLGRTTTFAVVGDRVMIGDQTFPSVAEYGVNLKPMRQVETITRPALVTDSTRAAWMRAESDLTPANGVRSVYAVSYAPMTPAFRDLVSGVDDRLWVQDPQGADHYPLLWTAYKGGQPVARAELPPRFYPTQFGPDWVLGLAFDTTSFDRVALLRLTPGALRNARLSPREAAPPNRPGCGAWTSR